MTPKKPFHVIRDGRVKATIWHEIRNGQTLFNVAFTRLIHDDVRWWDTACFQDDDMPALGRLSDDVYAWIALQKRDRHYADGGADDEGIS